MRKVTNQQVQMIYRLPRLSRQDCPFCKTKIDRKREYYVLLRNWQGIAVRFYKCQVPFCESCSIPYANQLLLNRIKFETDMRAEVFSFRKKSFLISEISRIPDDLAKKMKKIKELGFPIIERCTVSKPEEIELICNETIIDKCPACNGSLSFDKQIMIPISVSHQISIRGRECYYCKRFYVKDKTEKISQVFKNNTLAPWCKYDENNPYGKVDMGRQAWLEKEAKERRKQEMINKAKAEKEAQRIKELKHEELRKYANENPSTVVVISVQFQGGQDKDFYIVDKNSPASPENGIYRYTSLQGRELLSAAFAAERRGKGMLADQSFKVIDAFDSAKESYKGQKLLRDPYFIYIGKDGGNYSSVFKDKDCVLADILLYSPFTERYEIMKSTYNKRRDLYFTDIRHFREFVNQFGKPDGIDIEFDYGSRRNNGMEWNRLNTQSILNAYGYNVNQQEDLSSSYRQKLLAEVVDLDILSIRSICDYLEFFIRSHPSNHEAITRWEEDMEFISNYKYNPERFSIMQK